MGHLLYLMFRCDRGCDGKFGKFGNFVGTKHTLEQIPGCASVNFPSIRELNFSPCHIKDVTSKRMLFRSFR